MRRASELWWGWLTLATVLAYALWCLHILLWRGWSTDRLTASATVTGGVVVAWLVTYAIVSGLRRYRRSVIRDRVDSLRLGSDLPTRRTLSPSDPRLIIVIALVAVAIAQLSRSRPMVGIIAGSIVVAIVIVSILGGRRNPKGTATLLLVAGTAVAGALAMSSVRLWSPPAQALIAIVASVPVLMLVAWQWSRTMLRLLAVGVVVFAVAAAIQVGRTSSADGSRASVRLDSIALDTERSAAHTDAAATFSTARAATLRALADLDGETPCGPTTSCSAPRADAAAEAITTACDDDQPSVECIRRRVLDAGYSIAATAPFAAPDALPETVAEALTTVESVDAAIAALDGAQADDERVPDIAAASVAVGALARSLRLTADLGAAEAAAGRSIADLCSAGRGSMVDLQTPPSKATATRSCIRDPFADSRARDDLRLAAAIGGCGLAGHFADAGIDAEPLRRTAVADAVAERDVVAMLLIATPDAQGLDDRRQAAVAALSTACTNLQSADPSTSIADLARRGANEIVSAAPGIETSSGVPIGLAAAGWIVLGLLVVAGYRHLEISSNRRGLGQVTFEPFEATPSAKQDEYSGLFKRHVLGNVSEPGSIPGALSTQSLTDLVDLGVDPASKFIGKVIGVLRALTAPVPGYRVAGFYQAIDQPAGEAAGGAVEAVPVHEVFVRVNHLRSSAVTKTVTARDASPELAIRKAAYRVAAYVLQSDTTQPEWTSWGESATDALAEYDAARSLSGGARLAKLRDASRDNPNSGLVLAMLANELALQSKHVEVLEAHLRATIRHPRYPVVRYRLPISLANVSIDRALPWTSASVATRQRVCFELERCASACGIVVPDLVDLQAQCGLVDGPAVDAAVVSAALLRIAAAFERDATRLFGRIEMTLNTLQRSERRLWLPMMSTARGRRDARRWRRMTALVGASIEARQGGTPDPSAKRGDGAQALYNIACVHGVVGSTAAKRQALRFLEQMLEMDGSGRIVSAWVRADPDLQSIATEPRFVALCGQLSGRDLDT